MRNKKKLILIAIATILLVLIITNPTTSRFKEYLNSKGIKTESYTYYSYLYDDNQREERKIRINITYGRENNYFIFSFFNWDNSKKYFGILGNFYELNE
ncbi:MAG: hypothetical protein A2X08_16800 [Bacteroidetes bacterium GWA2_32_17]|nr:MAG: hypothetical protein A2X08_16800 [Bacteroidetes bacterium GWA2_32_17]